MVELSRRDFSAYDGDTDARYEAAGLGHSVGFGDKPALLIVDLHLAFTDPTQPLGANLDAVVAANAQLVALAHEASIPVFATRTGYRDPDDEVWPWTLKAPGLRTLRVDGPGFEMDPRLGLSAGDTVITKKFNSAFFGTELVGQLATLAIDTLIVTGATTSGCVRATVTDSAQHQFRTIVPREAVGDRSVAPHEASLYDMNAKWADVLPMSSVVEHMSAMIERSSEVEHTCPA